MNRELMWTPVQWQGCEHLHVWTEGGQITADGVVVAMLDGVHVRLHYQVVCDGSWRTQRVMIEVRGQQPLVVVRQGDDRWYEAGGAERAELAGCVDVDIALTPFTNTLPIRRLGLEPGESADLRIVYVQVEPALALSGADQRYTRLESGADADYRYQSGSFVADLKVDADGLVTEYPDLWWQVR